MNTTFSFEEKMAIIKITVEVIKADGKLHPNEMKIFEQLKTDMGFNISMTEDAEDLPIYAAYEILSQMSPIQKKEFSILLYDVANADNFIHNKELNVIIETLLNISKP